MGNTLWQNNNNNNMGSADSNTAPSITYPFIRQPSNRHYNNKLVAALLRVTGGNCMVESNGSLLPGL